MNIIYTGAFRFPDKDAASQRVLANAKIVRDLGHDVHFCGWEQKEVNQNNRHQGFKYTSQSELDLQNSNPFKKLYFFLFKGQNTLKWIKSHIKTNKVDIIIIYNGNAYFSYILNRFGKKHNIKIIADCTEWYEGEHLPGGKYGLANFDNNLRMKYILPRIKNLIVISSYLENYYAKKGCNLLKLPPLVDLTDDKWSNTQNISINHDEPIQVMYAGDPGKKDTLKIVMDALQKVNETKLCIIFKILGISKVNLMKNLGVSELPPFIFCLGRIPMQEVPNHYFSSSYSILLRENKRYANAGFSTKLVESMVCGVPVIANKTSDIENFVNSDNGYLIDSLTEQILVELFKSLLNKSEQEHIQMKKNAFLTAKKFFSYPEYSDRFEEYLINLN